ncbi:hypothetical protein HS041_22580 [Planomonospora sp. ID67723]|uniref:hypothetical protein n=1 Tax=Planomonospora sp. ID67723 TaxID=2738134 RepID=UPI0018C43DDF|nr:hypothetical protein [Planomonospora sp. ID67723]MBG0830552.1 hypothetical protein [Planomonospora sp. ID67723]
MAASPERISAVRSIAAHKSWAQTAVRRERTEAGTKASPVSLDYWIKMIQEAGKVRGKKNIELAAESARTAYMRELALKSAEARRAKKTARKTGRKAA